MECRWDGCTEILNKEQEQITSLLSYSKKHVEGVNKGSRAMNREIARILEMIMM